MATSFQFTVEEYEELVAANARAPGHAARQKRITMVHAKLSEMGHDVVLPEFGSARKTTSATLQAYARENGTDSEEAAQSRPKESKVLGGKKPKKCTAQVFEMSDIEKHNRTRTATKHVDENDTVTASLLNATKKNDCDAALWALDQGACVNDTDRLGNTALHVAAMKGLDAVAQILCEAGASQMAVSNLKLTPLGTACKFKRAKVAELCLLHGAPVDMQTMQMVVAMQGTPDCDAFGSVLQTVLDRVENMDEASMNADFMIGVTAADVMAISTK